MGGIGFPELMVICVIALLVFGPKRLPEAGKALGQAIRDFKASMDGKEDIPTRPKTPQALLSCPQLWQVSGGECGLPRPLSVSSCRGAARPSRRRSG